MTLTPEDRRLLAAAYRLMVSDAKGGDVGAVYGLADSFWRLYADVFFGGYEVMIERLARAQKLPVRSCQ